MQGSDYGMKYVRQAMSLAPENAKVLDVGCGSSGRIIDEAVRRGFQISGIDVSAQMIKSAKIKHPGIPFIHNDFITWNSSGTYDLIIAWDSIFHASKNLQAKAVRKMCGLLNKKGVLLFTAGGIDDERSGEMHGIKFDYGSLDYMEYLNILNADGLRILLMESDQFPLNHMVFIAVKT